MTAQSVLTAVAIVIAIVALLRARRIARRLEKVVESYWELRYDYGQLRAQMDKLQGRPDDPIASASTAFVPLSRLRSPENAATLGETQQPPALAESPAESAVPAAIKRP